MTSQPAVLDRDVARVGPEVAYRLYLLESQGPVVGGSSVYLPPRGQACCHEVRVRPQIGYGVFPLPHESRLGFEFMTGPSFGNLGVNHDGYFAVGGMAEVGMPIRVTRTRDLWEQSLIENIGMLVPKVGIEILSPQGDVSHRSVTALELSLNFRIATWHKALP